MKVSGYTLSFEKADELGRGSFGRVVRGWKGDKRPGKSGTVAVKLITVGLGREEMMTDLVGFCMLGFG